MHIYSEKSFRTSAFHVVHRNGEGALGATVAGSNDEDMAKQDALARNRRAVDMKLDCSYVVKPREEGEPR